MNWQTLGIFGIVVILFLTVAMPLLGIWDFRRFLRHLAEGRADARTSAYRWVLFMEWTLTLVIAGWWLADGRGLSDLGLVPAVDGWQWLAVGLGLAATVFMIGQMVVVLRKPSELERLREQVGEVAALGPHTEAEGRLFTLVCVTAGVCEEIIYRGVLLAVLAQAFGIWTAMVVSSVIFGLGHAYQGPAGIAKTSLIGLVMALLAVFSGSLFVPMVLHAVVDLTSGRLMAAANSQEAAPTGAVESTC
ncbi:MAG: CPBP family intramembrane metalloprotease [bacterium]|nr:CPBP family intramembrane metalloprotease [bacterium]